MKVNISRYFKNAPHRHKVEITSDDTYSLDYTLALIIYPALVKFKDLNNGYPGLVTEKGWDEILDKMIAAFKWVIDDNDSDDGTALLGPPENISEGLILFGKWYSSLWW